MIEKGVMIECPICGGNNFVQLYEPFTMNTPIGSRSRQQGCYCADCGIKFAYNCTILNSFDDNY